MKRLWALSITLIMVIGIFNGFGQDDVGASMFRTDLKHSGIYDSEVPDNYSLLWSFDCGDTVESSPVVAQGNVYLGAENGILYCLDALTGAERWSFETENEVDSTPSVVDDVVYFGSSDMKFYALDANTGAELWNHSFESTFGQIVSSPAVVDDLIFIGSKDDNLYAINITTHEIEWEFTTQGEIWSSPAVSWPYVYIGSLDGKLYCVWGNNGTEKWNHSSNLTNPTYAIYASPLISNGRVYIGSEDYNLYCLDLESGNLLWTFTAPRYIYSSAAVHKGRVFIHTQGSPDGFLFALPENDPNDDGIIDDSEVLWSYDTGDWDGGSSPSVANGKVVVGSRDKNLYCFNETTGELIWNFTAEAGMVSTPVISLEIVYIASRDGTVYALSGEKEAPLEIQINPEYSSIKGGRVMGISFLVTFRGYPVEGAFINVEVSEGNLSQYGASTFPDGTQRIKFTAPVSDANITVSAIATATKYGYPDGKSETQFTVEPATSYANVKSEDTFSLAKYWLYLVLIVILITINIIMVIIHVKKKKFQG
jgi:outer membrane protein assembly factor BamB